MEIQNREIDLEGFYRQLDKSFQKLLILDYDGTLAPFHIDPSKAVPYPGIIRMLNRIMKNRHVKTVIVSGRWTKDIVPLLQLDRMPEIWGSHGLERLKEDGTYEVAEMEKRAVEGIVLSKEWIDRLGLSNRSEMKPGCLAIHWRGLNRHRIDSIKAMIEDKWSLILKGYGLEIKQFDGGMEFRVPGRNKGDAVKTLLNEAGRDYVAAYLGDDMTDEDAFHGINGKGIGILVRKKWRRTAADIWIKPPEELLEFLSHWIGDK
ncbi:MAG: trehalose-phosphatase [Deltaproteobacteria bacterium]|nr:trehalose-phosphatase [Deltaproteobacteria bacterium]